MLIILEIFLGAMTLVFVVSTFIGIPCLPTHRAQARRMIELSGIGPGDMVIDLGAGHGRLLFLAADRGARAIGYELNPFLVAYIWIKSKIIRTRGVVEIHWRSLFHADVSRADAVFCFLFERHMAALQEKLFREMKAGSRIVAYVFPFRGRAHRLKDQGIFVYDV